MAVEHIVHSIPPTYDENSRVLVLGSLPSPKSRECGFNYGHPRNRFWTVMAHLADEPAPNTVERKRDFCLRHHIALWDVVAECDIEGASDASIRNAVPNDLAQIVSKAPIEAVFCTGSKAFELYGKLGCEEACGLPAVKLPSTSPANAQARTEELVSAYAQVFSHTHENDPAVLDVSAVRELEQRIADEGTSLDELMDRAGAAVAWRVETAVAQLRERGETPGPIVILCGSGNNGGDGWVAGELLVAHGFDICLITAKKPEELRAQPARDAALRAQAAFSRAGGIEIESGESAAETSLDREGHNIQFPLVLINPEEPALRSIMNSAGVVVDAILGIGFSGQTVKEPYATWINLANQSRSQHVTIAVDVPSGLDAQTGASVQPVLADETITMIVSKPGLAAPECGTVRVAPLAYVK